MSSPRRVLSPSKNHNKATPSKQRSVGSPFLTRLLPRLNNNQTVMTPVNTTKKPRLTFTIYEDAVPHKKRTPSPVRSNRLDHNDQENILQPKPLNLKQYGTVRKPLTNLDINEYPGYINYALGPSLQLKEVYYPPNFRNDSTNLHKFTQLPNFVTPPRRNLQHNDTYLVKSVEDEETILLSKQRALLRKKRSMSVGRNSGKLPLIRKNPFPIVEA